LHYSTLLIFTDSLVSSQVYEIVKTIYSTPASETSDSARVSVLQNTLGQLRLANIATLDAITTHFTRLIELTSADEAFISALAHNLALCILRPRVESSLTTHERHSYRLIRDLFDHKEAIFGELKRASTLSHTSSGAGRPRAISTDESNRRANMEARNRAIASRSRASSPQPTPGSRSHRRDRSTGGPDTRFPIQTNSSNNSPVVTATERRPLRQSLEVPGPNDVTPGGDSGLGTGTDTNTSVSNSSAGPVPSANKPLPSHPTVNGTSEHAIPATITTAPLHAINTNPTNPTTSDTDAKNPHSPSTSNVQKRDSLTRGVGRFPRKPGQGSLSLARQSLTMGAGAGGKRDSYGSAGAGRDDAEREREKERPAGVTLSDKPMDD